MNRFSRLSVSLLSLLVILFCARAAFSQSCTSSPVNGPGCSVANDIPTWTNTGGNQLSDPQSFQIVNTTTMQGNNATQSLVIQGGQDSSIVGTLGGIVVRGADASQTTMNAGGAIAGSVVVQGGDSSSTGEMGTFIEGGNLTLRPGAASGGGGGDVVPGYLVLSQTFKLGSAYTCPDNMHGGGCRLACMVGHNTVADCGTFPSQNPANNYVGVELPAISLSEGSAANVQVAGIAVVEALPNPNAQWAIGDIVCVDTANAGFVVDNGTNLCSTIGAAQVGIVALAGTIGNSYIHSVLLAR